jgi:long-chain acyl-CoA synthetase
MDYSVWQSLPALFFDKAHELSERNFLWAKREGTYQPITWGQTARAVKELSRGLRGLGLKPGERVVLVSENRPEWLIADIAIMAAGGITVPAYITNTTGDHNHILTHSGAKGAIVSTRALASRLLPAAVDAPDCEWVIAMEDLGQEQATSVDVHLWEDILEAGRILVDDVEEIVARSKREETACYIYTSGTGGVPKGVMLSHGAILCNCMGAYHVLEAFGLGDEVFLCFLPLSHSYEHTAGQMFPISIGAQIYYAESIEQLLNNLAEARPTIMTAVPRLYETMHLRIRRGVEKQGGIIERLVRDKVRGRFGGRLKAMVSGGAALNSDIGIFFTALGLTILQGYGQTEASPVIACNPLDGIKMDTVGKPLAGVEVKIAEDGEILVRGELVMNGYWHDDEATAATVRDGWLHTGDIGELDDDGYLKITDRKKDIIVFSGGDNVSPARVESFLTLQPELGQAMVYGDKRPHLVALVVPDEEFLRAWAKERDKAGGLADLSNDPDLRTTLGQVIDRVNKQLSPLEKVRRFAIAPKAFSVENHMMTPTMKIRRHKIKEAYGEMLDALYAKK